MQNTTLDVTMEQPGTALSPRADGIVLKITGEVGMAAVMGPDGEHSGVDGDTALGKKLRDLVPVPPALVVIDLSAATYLSSLGIGVLLGFQKWLRSSGSDLRLAAASSTVTLLRRCRLDQVFTIFPDVASALQAK